MWEFPEYNIGTPINWDVLEQKYTWFADMRDVPQDDEWHAEGDVFIHTKMVVEALVALKEFQELEAQDKHILFCAALMHDIEKRSTTTTEIIDGKERIVSPKHARKGENTVRTILYKEIPAPFFIREQIAKLVRHHGLPLWAIEKNDPVKTVIEASLSLNTKLLAILAKADVLGRTAKDKEDILFKIQLFEELCKDNNCYGKAREFKSESSRFEYLNKDEISPDYVPFDDFPFKVYVMCAVAGSGKDTYIKKHLDLPVLSLDDIRREHKISPTDSKKNGWVIQQAKEIAKEYMRSKQSFVFNATNITIDRRSKWIDLFKTYRGYISIIYIEVPYKTLIKQNKKREHAVPSPVIESMISKLEVPTLKEAHSIKYIIR